MHGPRKKERRKERKKEKRRGGGTEIDRERGRGERGDRRGKKRDIYSCLLTKCSQ
jgi:hypothetical protein